VVFPCIDRSALRRCVIVSDSFGFDRAIDEATALEHAGQTYVVAAPPSNRCLHAKVWLIATDAEAVLLVGSGNLTQSGFVGNAELFDVLRVTTDAPASTNLVLNVRQFLDGLASLWPQGSSSLARAALAEISEAVAALPVRPSATASEPAFIHSCHEAIIAQLPDDRDTGRISVAAPFFGGDVGGIELLTRKYPQAKLRVFPAVHREDSIDMPLKRLHSDFENVAAARLRVRAKPSAFAHLKLYAAEHRGGGSWIFCTSANCTRAALGGHNIEAGVLRHVTPAQIAEYFETADKTLPDTLIEHLQGDPPVKRLHLVGVDEGHSLRLFADAEAATRPITDVVVTLRTGNAAASVSRTALFSRGDSEALAWAEFPGWVKPRNRAIRVDIRAVDPSGNEVRASTFVENRLLLTSDPVHRSAWRGALALLDTEATPELADIAAVFALARGVFDVPLHPVESSIGPKSSDGPSLKPGLAVWPPQPDLHDLHRQLSKAATGQIRWFQEVMRALLAAPLRATSDATGGESGADSSGGDADEAQRLERQARALSLAERLWNHATRDYDSFYGKMHGLEPAGDNAAKVWPVAVFTFLATMAALQASIRMSAEVDWATDVDFLKDDFVRLMFTPRKQPNDYCCPKNARYRRETFPSLSEDLIREFGERVHPELAAVVLAVFADQRMRSGGDKFKVMWEQRMRQIWSSGMLFDNSTKDVCRRIWQRFLIGEARNKTVEDFDNALDELCAIAATL